MVFDISLHSVFPLNAFEVSLYLRKQIGTYNYYLADILQLLLFGKINKLVVNRSFLAISLLHTKFLGTATPFLLLSKFTGCSSAATDY